MVILRTVLEMREIALAEKRKAHRVGLVPTMGCLHDGHLSLVKLARQQTDFVVVSIFVNPTQFLPGEDFSSYPRTFERDVELCRGAGVDAIFFPETAQIYAADHSVFIEETHVSQGLCGASRPGHFRGVATVVAKLFNIVLPDIAVFGQKDAQQVRVIQRLVRDLNFPVTVIVGPIVREPDGLALSSRNRYLTDEERRDALCLHRALAQAERLSADGERSVATLRSAMLSVLATVPSVWVDYVEVVDDETLMPVERIERPVLIALAVRIGKTRLIDNCVIR